MSRDCNMSRDFCERKRERGEEREREREQIDRCRAGERAPDLVIMSVV